MNFCIIFAKVFLAILICCWVGFDVIAVVVVFFLVKKLLLVSQFSFDDSFHLTGKDVLDRYCVIAFMTVIAAWRCLLAVDMAWGYYSVHLIVLAYEVCW